MCVFVRYFKSGIFRPANRAKGQTDRSCLAAGSSLEMEHKEREKLELKSTKLTLRVLHYPSG